MLPNGNEGEYNILNMHDQSERVQSIPAISGNLILIKFVVNSMSNGLGLQGMTTHNTITQTVISRDSLNRLLRQGCYAGIPRRTHCLIIGVTSLYTSGVPPMSS